MSDSIHVLIIDDDAEVRTAVRRSLHMSTVPLHPASARDAATASERNVRAKRILQVPIGPSVPAPWPY